MSNCFNIHCLQHFSELDWSRWKKAHPGRHCYQPRDSRHFTWALLCWYFPTPCWTAAASFGNDSPLRLSVKSNRVHHRFFPAWTYRVAYFHTWQQSLVVELSGFSGQGGSRARCSQKDLPGCCLAPAGSLLWPKNIIWSFLIQYTCSTVKAVVQLVSAFITQCWGFPLPAIRGCREILGEKMFTWVNTETNWIWEYRSTISSQLIPIS